ncbi:urease accessory protein UreF [Thalassovita mangrovi]|uniref:Urease accessory protein UreF n=1 Tax=Thalassovita mangrovi TaxID=2692236 RepID=A0A6L8LIF7_9RHOB|nr:urease accessory protein UreF [Thalassovita mangrovi]MYM55635.1 urease accessory protein UreF [Thalassovita mangrovi]
MITDTALLTLAQWLSPAYPVGAFSYSHGLEWAVETGQVRDADSFRDWLEDILRHGTGRNDAILLACAHRSDPGALRELDDLARAYAPSKERLLETEAQGAAFCRTTAAIWGDDMPDLTYPVAVGYAARAHGFPLRQTSAMYLHAFASNLTSAAIRLVPLGQTEGQAVLTALTPLCETLAAETEALTPDDLGGSVFMADIAAMKHETQYTRLFRS